MTDTTKKILKITGWSFLGLIGLLLIAVVVFFSLAFRTYANAKDRFSLSYPSSWKVVPHSQPEALVAFVSPKEGALDSFQENVAITVAETGAPMTLAEYVKAASDQVTSILQNVKLLESVPAVVSGRKAWRMVFQSTEKPPSIIAVYVFLKGSSAYNIMYIGSAANYNKRDRWHLLYMIHSLKGSF